MGKKHKKYRVLMYGDSPTCATGFATVVKNIADQLHKTGMYDIDIIGINYYDGYYDREQYPYRIIPAMKVGDQDFFGKNEVLRVLLGQHPILKPPYDIVWTVQDSFVMESIANSIEQIRKVYDDPVNNVLELNGKPFQLSGVLPEMRFKWIGYWPVDSDLKPNWVKDSIFHSDYPVIYTNYGKQEVEVHNFLEETYQPIKSDISVIYHGVDTDTFYPISKTEKKKFREKFFEGKIEPDHFLITNVNRNQPRKDIPRTLKIFKEFQRRVSKARLYLHMKGQDVGGNIDQVADKLGLERNKDYFYPVHFNENKGLPVETLNKIYNVSDVIMSSTLGEGFGLSYIEAMAAKALVLAPNNTAAPEIFDQGKRGYLYNCGTTTSEWVNLGVSDNERWRPLGNVDSAVEQLVKIYNNPKEVKEKIDKAYEFALNHTWEAIGRQWHNLIQRAIKDLGR